jgi:hypothetical protein
MKTKKKIWSWGWKRRVLVVTGVLTAVVAFLCQGFDMMPQSSLATFPLSAISALTHNVMYFYTHFYGFSMAFAVGSFASALADRLPKRWWVTIPLWVAVWFVIPPVLNLTYLIASGADNAVQGWWIGIAIDWLIMQPVFWFAWALIGVTVDLVSDIRIAPRAIYRECRSLFLRGKHRRRRFV